MRTIITRSIRQRGTRYNPWPFIILSTPVVLTRSEIAALTLPHIELDEASSASLLPEWTQMRLRGTSFRFPRRCDGRLCCSPRERRSRRSDGSCAEHERRCPMTALVTPKFEDIPVVHSHRVLFTTYKTAWGTARRQTPSLLHPDQASSACSHSPCSLSLPPPSSHRQCGRVRWSPQRYPSSCPLGPCRTLMSPSAC